MIVGGADVSGIDVEVPTFIMRQSTLFKVWKNSGMDRAIKSSIRHHIYDKKFYEEELLLAFATPRAVSALDFFLSKISAEKKWHD